MLNEKFLERMQEYLGSEYQAFLNSLKKPNIRSIRINNKFIDSNYFEEITDIDVTPIEGIKDAFYLNSSIKLGFHPLHHAGAIYSQDPSAMLPPLAISFKDNFLALDLCAAPGGKTLELANLLKNGYLIANEIDYKRAKVLYSNVERFGLNNVTITNNDVKDFIKDFSESFDLILVDAPCSGEGMFRKYPETCKEWSIENIELCHKRDIKILESVDKILKRDGILIYSTCTFAKEENEDIVNFLTENFNYELLDVNPIIKGKMVEGFIPNTYRFYPHKGEGEGQFLAVLKKRVGNISTPKKIKKYDNCKEFIEFSNKNLKKKINHIIVKNELFYQAIPYDLSSLKVLNYGVKLGEIINKRFVPNHNLFKSFSELFINKLELDYKDPLVMKYLRGEQITYNVNSGFGVLCVNGIPLGGFKANNNVVNNYYPKGLRNF